MNSSSSISYTLPSSESYATNSFIKCLLFGVKVFPRPFSFAFASTETNECKEKKKRKKIEEIVTIQSVGAKEQEQQQDDDDTLLVTQTSSQILSLSSSINSKRFHHQFIIGFVLKMNYM